MKAHEDAERSYRKMVTIPGCLNSTSLPPRSGFHEVHRLEAQLDSALACEKLMARSDQECCVPTKFTC